MLSSHCPKCGSPLFEFRGKTICPVCDEEKVSKKEKPEEGAKARKPPRDKLEYVLLRKLDKLADELEKETNPRSMSEILELIRSTLDTLDRIREG